MNNDILIYIKYDENKSIIDIRSNIFLDDKTDYMKIDEWKEGEDRYIYAHADNGEYVELKHGKPLFDENFKPNFHDDFVEWTEEEKQKLYPDPLPQPNEQDLINADLYMQLAQLQTQGISLMSLDKSPRYELIEKYYNIGIYNKECIEVFVLCNWITEEEYKSIIKE